jgi:hypothetical protein
MADPPQVPAGQGARVTRLVTTSGLICMTGPDHSDPGARTISLILMRLKSELMQWYCERQCHTGPYLAP